MWQIKFASNKCPASEVVCWRTKLGLECDRMGSHCGWPDPLLEHSQRSAEPNFRRAENKHQSDL